MMAASETGRLTKPIVVSKQLAVFLAACFLLLAVAATAKVDLQQGEEDDVASSYIVHVAPAHAPPSGSSRLGRGDHHYESLLRDLLPARMSRRAPRVLYSYAHAATGFAARLTAREAAHLLEAHHPSVVLAVMRDEMYQLHTTHSSAFLGLSPSSGVQAASNGATDAVIAVLDTGIYPDGRASFDADPSLSPPPRTFRGGCVSTPAFNATAYCNNKLVGAKMFYAGYEQGIGHPIDEALESKSPLDTEGHGTHTASTAAGAPVRDASLFGFARGTATGTAPGARIAVYKVCWKQGCAGSDILAAMDEAIADGVDVISLSLGGGKQKPLHADPVAIAGFSAVRKGIVLSASANNDGPGPATVTNAAPWAITVGASNTDRRFPAVVVLGNGRRFVGTSLFPGDANGSFKPLIHGSDAGSAVCAAGKLVPGEVAGKIVLCDYGNVSNAAKSIAVYQAGGYGVIVSGKKERGELVTSTAFPVPGSAVAHADAEEIRRYVSGATPYPTAKILFYGTVFVGGVAAPSFPRVASFSGRGPFVPVPGLVKPDLVAPGVDVLAAWTGANSPTKLPADTRRVEFNVDSGTSMACPHVSGVAALLKVARPGWSPGMIKSALMTTAYAVDSSGEGIRDTATGEAATPFALGAGHVDPNRALDPGLVYDVGVLHYIYLLCGLGYPETIIDGLFVRDGSTVTNCSALDTSGGTGDLNLPAFSVEFQTAHENTTAKLTRVLTNVGDKVDAVYTASVVAPPGTRVTVTPPELVFDSENQQVMYYITVSPVSSGSFDDYTQGSIVWTDGVHQVRSPIVVTWPPSTSAAAVSAM